MKLARVLSIAGSDSGGGAGIQADIKTITMLGGYASTAITAITAQNTQEVTEIHPLPVDIIIKQIDAVLSDIGADAIKIGMLYSEEIIISIANYLSENAQELPIILDPVMVSSSGSNLLKHSAIEAIKDYLIPLTYLITPNIPEAQLLAGDNSKNPEALAEKLYDKFNCNILVKGGHSEAKKGFLEDVLIFYKKNNSPLVGESDSRTESGGGLKNLSNAYHQLPTKNTPPPKSKISTPSQGESYIKNCKLITFPIKYIETKSTHGTGCTLSSAIATQIAQGNNLTDALKIAQDYVHQAILNAKNIGSGHGPLKHNWALDK